MTHKKETNKNKGLHDPSEGKGPHLSKVDFGHLLQHRHNLQVFISLPSFPLAPQHALSLLFSSLTASFSFSPPTSLPFFFLLSCQKGSTLRSLRNSRPSRTTGLMTRSSLRNSTTWSDPSSSPLHPCLLSSFTHHLVLFFSFSFSLAIKHFPSPVPFPQVLHTVLLQL